MAWKNLPIWLKYGIILAVLSSIFLFIFYLIPNLEEKGFLFIVFLPIFSPLFYFSFFHGYITSAIFGAGSYMFSDIEELIFLDILPVMSVIIFYFLIGALIGWLSGRCKVVR